LLLIYYDAIPVRWSPGASFFTQKIALLSKQTHETKRILWEKLHIPPPNNELQTQSGAPVGPVHVAKVCGKATSYLVTFDATKLPAAAAHRCCLGKFVAGRAQGRGPCHHTDATGGIQSNFACRGGGCPPSFLLQSNLPWCPCTPKPRMSLLLGQMCTCFLVWPSPQNNFWKKQNVRNLFLGKWDCKYGQTYFVTTTVNSSLNSSVLKCYFFIFSQKRKGKQNSYMVYIDSYVRYIHGGADICWHDQISSAQISADICKYLRISADIFYEGTCVQYNFFCSKNNYHVFAAACKLRAP
jgi:hypothetical protein